MKTTTTYLLTQADVEKALTMAEALETVEAAFKSYGDGRIQMPPKVYILFEKGDLRCMPVYMPELGLAAVKNVNVHPANSDLPAVMGMLTVFDPETGFPLAVMDATFLTGMRTGAAGGIAARHLARRDSSTVGFIGAGRQAETQLEALMLSLPGIRQVLVHDLNRGKAEGFAERVAKIYGVKTRVCAQDEAVAAADVVTTVTPARQPVVWKEYVRPGTHINAIGADAAGKQELESAVVKNATIVIDNWEQASHSGEINVPLSQGIITRNDLHADIGEIVTGRKPGRCNVQQVTVFDSTGLAIQDVACAAHVYRRVMSDDRLRKGLRTIDFLARD